MRICVILYEVVWDALGSLTGCLTMSLAGTARTSSETHQQTGTAWMKTVHVVEVATPRKEVRLNVRLSLMWSDWEPDNVLDWEPTARSLYAISTLRVCRLQNSRTPFWTPRIAFSGLNGYFDHSSCCWKAAVERVKDESPPDGRRFFSGIHVNFDFSCGLKSCPTKMINFPASEKLFH